MSLLVMGGGRMGSAIVGGLLSSGRTEPEDLVVVEPRPEARAELSARFPAIAVAESPRRAQAAVLAVKPADAEAACSAIASAGAPERLLSIAAGVTTGRLESWLGAGTAVLRAMPNIPAVLRAGASALAGGTSAAEEDFAFAEEVLSSFGVVARVPENLLDAVTGLSGSGPAYVMLLAEAMITAGVAEGLEREVSALLVAHTVLGAGRLLAETGRSPEALRAEVTSPAGTTVAGLRALEAGGFRSLVESAVAAAAARSRELGRLAGGA